MAAHVVEQKGAAHQCAVQRILDDIRMFGHTDTIMKGDGEPALVQVQREIVGVVERGVQEFMNQKCAMKIGLEQRIKMKIDTS